MKNYSFAKKLSFYKKALHFISAFLLLTASLTANAQDNKEIKAIVYPNNQEWAKPGDKVTIEFNKNCSNYIYRSEKIEPCYNLVIKGKISGKEYVRTGADCIPLGSNVAKENVQGKNAITITIPEDYTGSNYTVYYGYSKHYVDDWYCLAWIYTENVVEYKGFFNIRVFSGDASVFCTTDCFCPGSELEFEVENFFQANTFKISYSDKNGNSENDIEIPANDVEIDPVSGKGNIKWTVPENVNSDIKCTIESAGLSAETNLYLCRPTLAHVPDCVSENVDFTFRIENACPTITYEIEGLGQTKKFNGSSSYDVTGKVNRFTTESIGTSKLYYHIFKFKSNGEVLAEYMLSKCKDDVSIGYKNNTINLDKGECFATKADIKKIIRIIKPCNVSWQHSWHDQFDKNNDDITKDYNLEFKYREETETEFDDLLETTKLYAGKKYVICTFVYKDGELVKTENSQPIEIKRHDNGQGNYNTYKLIVRVNEGGGQVKVTSGNTTIGFGESAQINNLRCGDKVRIQTKANECYVFSNWKQGSKDWEWPNPTDYASDFELDIYEDTYLNAKFSNNDILFTVNSIPNNSQLGSVTMKRYYADFTSGSTTGCNTPIEMTATEKGCGKFVMWNDGVKDVRRTVYVKNNTNLIAIFDANKKNASLTNSTNNLTQTITLGNAITPIEIASSTSTIKDVTNLATGLTFKHQSSTGGNVDAVNISGSPTTEGEFHYTIETTEEECVNGTASLDVTVIVEPEKVECKNYATLSLDGSVRIPLKEVLKGKADNVALSNGFTLTTDGFVTGTVPFNQPQTITITATQNRKVTECTSTITVYKQVAPCGQ